MLPKDDPNHIPNFTGISDPFEQPDDADLIIETNNMSIDESVEQLINFIKENTGEVK